MRSETSLLNQVFSEPVPAGTVEASRGIAQPRWSRSAFVALEILLGLGAITLVNVLAYPGDMGFQRVSLHPYWLVVLLVSVRYGFFAGVASGACSALLYMGMEIMEGPNLNLVELESYEFWGLPLFFLVVGAALGEMRQSQIVKERKLTMDLADIGKVNERLNVQYKALRLAKDELDSRIVSQEQTLSTLYESAQALRSLEERKIYPAILELLHKYAHVGRSSIYLYRDGVFTLAAWRGEGEPPAAEREAGDDMMSRAVRSGRTQTLNTHLFSEIGTEGLLVSAPVNDILSGRVFGVINVEDMPFLKFKNETVKIVSMLAEWCGSSIANARLHEETRSRLITDESVPAYTPQYLRTRLKEEFLRARRFKQPLSLVGLVLEGLQAAGPEERKDVALTFSLALKSKLRAIDMLFLYDHVGRFVLLLPNTTREDARIVARNIREKYASSIGATPSRRSGVKIRTKIAALKNEYEDAEALLSDAIREDEHE